MSSLSGAGPQSRTGPAAGPRPPLPLLVHSWLGLKLSLVLLVVVLAGTVATVSHELDWLLDPTVRARPGGEAASLGELLEIVRRERPGYAVSAIWRGPHGGLPGPTLPFALRFDVTTPAGAERVVFVDPYERRITGERSYFDLPFVLRQLHYRLFAYPYGFLLNCLLGAMVLAGLVAGLMSYPRFWRGLLRWPKRTQGPRVYWPTLHRWLGVWSSWFVFLIGATVVWYFAQEMLYWSGNTALARTSQLSAAEVAQLSADGARHRPLDELLARAERTLPDFRPQYVILPDGPQGTLMVWGQTSAAMVRDLANQVHLNPYTGDVIWSQHAGAAGVLARLAHSSDRLHYGTLGGVATKLVWLAFGLALAALIGSGTVVHVRRAVKLTDAWRSGRAAEPVDAAARRLSWQLHWLGRWRWANAAVLVVATVGAVVAYSVAHAPAAASAATAIESPGRVSAGAPEACGEDAARSANPPNAAKCAAGGTDAVIPSVQPTQGES